MALAPFLLWLLPRSAYGTFGHPIGTDKRPLSGEKRTSLIRAPMIFHFWGSELLYVPPEPGQEYRHNDLLDPVWTMFDLAPEGRGDFQPKLDYTSGSGK